jgi:hypothetical protein
MNCVAARHLKTGDHPRGVAMNNAADDVPKEEEDDDDGVTLHLTTAEERRVQSRANGLLHASLSLEVLFTNAL